MFTKFLSLLTIASHGLKIYPYAAHGTEKVGQHCVKQSHHKVIILYDADHNTLALVTQSPKYTYNKIMKYCSRSDRGPSIYDVHKKITFLTPPPTWAGPPSPHLWTSTHG